MQTAGDGRLTHRRQQHRSQHRGIGWLPLGRSVGTRPSFRPIPVWRSGLYIGDVPNGLLATLLAEPAVVNPPRRVWRDWALVGVVTIAAVIEGIFREDLVWGPWSMVAVALLGLTLLWRRQFPLAMTAIAMGTFIVLDQFARVLEDGPVEAFTSAFLLIHVYALFRWASGRDCAYGFGVMVAALTSGLIVSWTGIGDAIGGAIVLLFPAVLGAEVRHLVQRRELDREEVKARERELLARELHDTVAHHVSAIAVQAQAGRAVGVQNPAAALDALEVIEAEASRTLAEMRSIVGTLRETSSDIPAVELAPQAGLADIHRLAQTPVAAGGLSVEVHMSGVDAVGPTIGAALYRITQEAITNAHRHAVDATQIKVGVDRDAHNVRLIVDDDGTHQRSTPVTPVGFGLIGMTERAELLGGTLRVGPTGDCGWSVVAMIPLEATS